MSSSAPAPANTVPWRRFADSAIHAFHAYANWLVGISWKRFALLALLLLITTAILQEVPPFSWRVTELVTSEADAPEASSPRSPPGREPVVKIERPKSGQEREGVEISIDERGVRVTPRSREGAASAASAPSGAASAASSPGSAAEVPPPELPEVLVKLPPGADTETVRAAIEEAKTT